MSKRVPLADDDLGALPARLAAATSRLTASTPAKEEPEERRIVGDAIRALDELEGDHPYLVNRIEHHADVDCMLGRYYNNDDLKQYVKTAKRVLLLIKLIESFK